MKLLITYAVYFIILSIIFLAYVFLSGCAGNITQPADIIPDTPMGVMLKTVAATGWFTTFCLLSFFGGIMAISLGQKKIGGAVIVAAIATITFGLAIQRFPTWLALIGFTGSLIAAGYSILIKNRALAEIVEGIQLAKRELSGGSGDTVINKSQDFVQSNSTKKIVKQVKEKFYEPRKRN